MSKDQFNKKNLQKPTNGNQGESNEKKNPSSDKLCGDNCPEKQKTQDNQPKFSVPFMANPSLLDMKRNASTRSIEDKDLCTARANDLGSMPFVNEFDILKNSKGDFQIEGIQEEQIKPQMMTNCNAQNTVNNKIKSNSNTPKKNQLSNQEKEISLAQKIFLKQNTQSIILEAGLNTQTPSQLAHPQAVKSAKKEQKPILTKCEIKERKNYLTLSKAKNLLGLLVVKSNMSMKAYSEVETYHSKAFCCEMLYQDDCCFKWLLDLLFQIIFLPARIILFLLRVCFACFQEDEEEMPPQDNDLYKMCYKCHYCPFKCCGDWINQILFSFKLFICKGLWFLPEQAITLYNTTSLKCLIQCGLFFKNCCFFTSSIEWVENLNNKCCVTPFHLLGECLQSFCSPEGFCQSIFFIIKKISCGLFNQNCLQKVFFCFTRTNKIACKNTKEINVSYCCGCAIDTTGETQDVEQNL